MCIILPYSLNGECKNIYMILGFENKKRLTKVATKQDTLYHSNQHNTQNNIYLNPIFNVFVCWELYLKLIILFKSVKLLKEMVETKQVAFGWDTFVNLHVLFQ